MKLNEILCSATEVVNLISAFLTFSDNILIFGIKTCVDYFDRH